MRDPSSTVIIVGGPCTCRPGRYVRFIIPPGVPGCEAVISCRANDGLGIDSITEHPIPDGHELWIRVANFEVGE